MTTAEVTRDPDLLAAAAELRHRVFVGEQGVAAELEADGQDAAAAHVVLTRESQVVGAARMFAVDGDNAAGIPSAGVPSDGDNAAGIAVVGRVVVDAGQRGQGLGATVMAAAERWAADQGLPCVELHSQQAAIGFYQRLGYAGVGEPYLEAGITHLTMRKDLLPGLRRVRDEDASAVEALIGGIWAEYPGVVLDVDGEEPWLRAPATSYSGRGELWVVPAPDGFRLLGCVGWRPTPGGAELKSLYVAAACRRQGWGSRLVRFVERRSGGRGTLTVWSDSRFLDSHQMYARLGYHPTGATRELRDKSATVEFEFRGEPD